MGGKGRLALNEFTKPNKFYQSELNSPTVFEFQSAYWELTKGFFCSRKNDIK